MFHLSALLSMLGMAGLASADEGIDELLKAIPEISLPEPEEEVEAAPPPPEEQDAFPTYVEQVQQQVLAAWSPSKKIIGKNPRASFQVMLKISEDGMVSDLIAVESSGVEKFDRSVVDAIQAALPLPAPPSTLATQAAQGVVLTISAQDA